MGTDTFMVSTDARFSNNSHGDLMALNARKATAYCLSVHKVMSATNVQNEGVRGIGPIENTFMFRCLAP